ncbi:MAG: sigma-70 family RNA polymerase sigma factor [Paludibacteraceae bacterium]|nr:sigma-70 family RNA polymerase sigma factor [Paludibacteraceae bacterium]
MNRKYSTFADDVLVSMYADGDDDAFEELLKRHNHRIYNYILFYVRDRSVAEDLFQETFFKVITVIRQRRYVASDRFVSWVCRIARNLVIDYFRKGRGEAACSDLELDVELLRGNAYQEESQEDRMVYAQILDDVQRLVLDLPAVQQEIIRLRFYENLSFREIAERTNVPLNTALGRMHYAVQNIRRLAAKHNVVLKME